MFEGSARKLRPQSIHTKLHPARQDSPRHQNHAGDAPNRKAGYGVAEFTKMFPARRAGTDGQTEQHTPGTGWIYAKVSRTAARADRSLLKKMQESSQGVSRPFFTAR